MASLLPYGHNNGRNNWAILLPFMKKQTYFKVGFVLLFQFSPSPFLPYAHTVLIKINPSYLTHPMKIGLETYYC